jgi:hypothetical protein
MIRISRGAFKLMMKAPESKAGRETAVTQTSQPLSGLHELMEML